MRYLFLLGSFLGAILWAAYPSMAQSNSERAFPGLTYHGPTGLFLVPTAQVLQNRRIAFGIHRGVLKIGYGLLGVAEAGIAGADLYDDPDRRAWRDNSFIFAKLATEALAIRAWLPGIAVGAENCIARNMEGYYLSATWHAQILKWPAEATIGAGTGRFGKRAYGGFGVIPEGLFGRTLKLIGEFADEQADIGVRLALSRNLRLDFALLMDAIPPDDDADRGWSITIDRGLPGTSMTADLVSIYRAIIPEKRKKTDEG